MGAMGKTEGGVEPRPYKRGNDLEAAREINIVQMPSWWAELKENELPEPYKEIASLIGVDDAVKLFRMQGRAVYLGKRQKSGQQTENWIELVNIIGIDNANKIRKRFSDWMYFKKADELLRERRDEMMFMDFDGGNYGALATKYQLTERWVRDIIDGRRKVEQWEQVGLFGD